jgi:CHAT domain-containing protein
VTNYISAAEAEMQSGGDAKPFLAVAHRYALADSFVWKVWNLPEPLPNPYPVPAGVGFAGEWAKSALYARGAERLGEVYFMESRYPECANAMSAAVNIYLAAGSSALRAAAWDAICETSAGNLAKAQAMLLAATGWNATLGSPRRLGAGTEPETLSLVYDAWLGIIEHRESRGELSPPEAGAEQFAVFEAADRDETARAEEVALSGSGLSGLDPNLISSWRKARARLYSLDRQLASSTVFQPLTVSSATNAANFRRQREEARSEFERLDQMVAAKFGMATSGGPASLDNAEQLQSQLAADEVAIDILPLRFGLGLLAVTKDRIDYRYVPIADRRLDALIARYRTALDPALRGSAALDPEPLLAMAKLTLAPLRDLIQGKNRLTLIPHGGFQSIPLEALRVDVGTGSAPIQAADSVRYLGLEHEITYAPSITSLWLSRTAAPTATAGRPAFVGIGDPVIGHPELRQRVAGAWDSLFSWRGGGLNFSTLPETRDEIFRMRAIFGGAVRDTFLAAGATKQSLLNSEDLRSSRVIDFATHGVTAGKFGSAVVDQPFLLLSPSGPGASDDADTRLRMSDVISMNLQADLVILSACDTAASDGSQGSLGLSGLARAFLFAGARNVLVSHWEVESRTAYYFVTQFAENLVAKRMTYAAALLAARRSIAIDRGLSDPSYWSAFILLGDGNTQFVH